MKRGTTLGLIALLLAVGTAGLWFYLTLSVGLPKDRTLFAAAFLAAATLGVLAFFHGSGLLGRIPPAAAIVVGLFLPYTMYISPQAVESASVIKVGDVIPRFTALDDRRETFDSLSLNGHLVLIKFFRAHW